MEKLHSLCSPVALMYQMKGGRYEGDCGLEGRKKIGTHGTHDTKEGLSSIGRFRSKCKMLAIY